MRRNEPRLQRQLLTWLLVPLLVLLVLDAFVTYGISIKFSNLAHDRSLLELAREVALHVKPSGAGARLDMSPAAERILLVDQDDQVFFKVSGPGGQLVGGERGLPTPPRALAPSDRPAFYAGEVRGVPVRLVASWLPYDDSNGERVVLVQVAETLNKRNRLAWEILVSAVVPQLLLILAATVIVYVGVRHGLVPLSRLEEAVARRSHVDLSPIGTEGVPGEVRPLVDAVNDLMLRLGKTFDFQNRFIADAAHQLKTPVSGLKAQIELALREQDPQRVQHSLAQLYVSVDRLSRLVRQLLSLARNEPGAVEAVQLAPLDLNEFALETSMDWVPQALKHKVDLGFEGAGQPVTIGAEPDRLRELINNLIDNAVRYTRAGGRVTVMVKRSPGGAPQLSISDDGPAIPVAERKRIFERFHRLLGTHADGSGLGLAIVSEIATLHGAEITLEEDHDGVGNTFTVTFPAAGMPAP